MHTAPSTTTTTTDATTAPTKVYSTTSKSIPAATTSTIRTQTDAFTSSTVAALNVEPALIIELSGTTIVPDYEYYAEDTTTHHAPPLILPDMQPSRARPTDELRGAHAPKSCPPCLRSQPADLLLLLDTSQPETEPDVKTAIGSLLSSLPISDCELRVAIIGFSHRAILARGLDEVPSPNTALQQLSFLRSSRPPSPVTAVKLATKEMSRRPRAGAKRVVLLVTGGDSGDTWPDVIQPSYRLHDHAHAVLAISSRPGVTTMQLQEMIQYAGGQEANVLRSWHDFPLLQRSLRAYFRLKDCPGLPLPQATIPPLPTIERRRPEPGTEPPALISRTSSTSPVDEPDICSQPMVDLMLVLDTTGESDKVRFTIPRQRTHLIQVSIRQVFMKHVELAMELIRSIPKTEDFYRVGMVVIRRGGRTRLELPLMGTADERMLLMRRLKALQFGGEQSGGLAFAVLLAIEELKRKSRSHSRPMFVLFADGRSRDPWSIVKSASRQIAQLRATVFAASFSHDVAEPQLEAYTGSPDRLFFEFNAEDLILHFEAFLRQPYCLDSAEAHQPDDYPDLQARITLPPPTRLPYWRFRGKASSEASTSSQAAAAKDGGPSPAGVEVVDYSDYFDEADVFGAALRPPNASATVSKQRHSCQHSIPTDIFLVIDTSWNLRRKMGSFASRHSRRVGSMRTLF